MSPTAVSIVVLRVLMLVAFVDISPVLLSTVVVKEAKSVCRLVISPAAVVISVPKAVMLEALVSIDAP